MEEFEVFFLDIDVDDIQRKLSEIDAQKEGEYFYRRRVFDYPDFRMNKDYAWLRLRDEGEKVMLAFKKWVRDEEKMKEIEVEVGDFEAVTHILKSIGLIEKHYAENKRIRWTKDGTEFDVDFWPELEPYLEIEAQNWEKVNEAIASLGLDPKDQRRGSVSDVYAEKGIKVNDLSRITFEGLVQRESQA